MKSSLTLVIFSSFAISCASKPSEPMPSESVRSQLQKEIRLSDDNQQISELRKSLPEQKRRDNDDLAEYLKKIELAQKDPDRARNEWSQLIQKRREKFRDATNKLRETYSADERKRREDFTKEQNKKKDELRNRKLKPQASQEAFAKLGEEQREYFNNERLRRKDFEAEVQVQMKDFEHMVRERQQAFNEQLRAYKKKESNSETVPLSTEGD